MFNKNTAIAIVVALVLIGAAVYFSNLGADLRSSLAAVFFADKKESAGPLVAGGAPSLGRDSAKVTIIEFADFQCPSCALFHSGAGNAIIEEYVKKGLARVAHKDFPLLGEESFNAAYGARCAGEQGKFFEYQDALFSQQSKYASENSGMFSVEQLIRLADDTRLNKNIFSDCLYENKYKEAVAKDLEEGKAAGVTGTPTIFINGRKLEGLVSFENYKKIIEEELIK